MKTTITEVSDNWLFRFRVRLHAADGAFIDVYLASATEAEAQARDWMGLGSIQDVG
jgi:hypothetical protein